MPDASTDPIHPRGALILRAMDNKEGETDIEACVVFLDYQAIQRLRQAGAVFRMAQDALDTAYEVRYWTANAAFVVLGAEHYDALEREDVTDEERAHRAFVEAVAHVQDVSGAMPLVPVSGATSVEDVVSECREVHSRYIAVIVRKGGVAWTDAVKNSDIVYETLALSWHQMRGIAAALAPTREIAAGEVDRMRAAVASGQEQWAEVLPYFTPRTIALLGPEGVSDLLMAADADTRDHIQMLIGQMAPADIRRFSAPSGASAATRRAPAAPSGRGR